MKKKSGGGGAGGGGISASIIGRGSRLLSAYQIFTKYSTHHSLSVYIGFKSLAVILVEILHLQIAMSISKFSKGNN